MKAIVFVFIAIAIAGVVGIVLTVNKKKDTPQEVYAPKMTVYITLTLVFTIMAGMTWLFSK